MVRFVTGSVVHWNTEDFQYHLTESVAEAKAVVTANPRRIRSARYAPRRWQWIRRYR